MKKSVLITGASSGSGFAIAQLFAERGMNVFITSRNAADAERAALILREQYPDVTIKGYQLSVGNEDKVIEMFDDIKNLGCPLTSLVLNAANLGINTDPLTVELKEWMAVLETNLGWNFSIARQAALHMIENGGGSIVFVGSNTYKRAIKNRSSYIASKGGIVALSKALAIDFGCYNIRVNTLVPGSIKTARWDALGSEAQEQKRKRVPINNIADFDDLANAAWFLATDLSKNITGTELIIDGGADAQLFPNS